MSIQDSIGRQAADDLSKLSSFVIEGPFYEGETAKQQKRAPIVRWREALLRTTLSKTDKLVALVLATFAGENTNPAVGTLADFASLSRYHAREALKRLERAGWLHIEKSKGGGSGNTHRFYFTLPVAPCEPLTSLSKKAPERVSVAPSVRSVAPYEPRRGREEGSVVETDLSSLAGSASGEAHSSTPPSRRASPLSQEAPVPPLNQVASSGDMSEGTETW